jgi:hypothetical protein
LTASLVLSGSLSSTGRVLAQARSAAETQANTDIARKLQNPLAGLISLPLQSNTSFGSDPRTGTHEVLDIQPVVPFHLGGKLEYERR